MGYSQDSTLYSRTNDVANMPWLPEVQKFKQKELRTPSNIVWTLAGGGERLILSACADRTAKVDDDSAIVTH